jgi:hypothetical protein
MNDPQMTLDRRLAEEGWERRSVLSEPRLSEAVKEYEDLGFEVHLEPVQSGDPETGCDACFPADDTSRIIYTRPALNVV